MSADRTQRALGVLMRFWGKLDPDDVRTSRGVSFGEQSLSRKKKDSFARRGIQY